MDWYYIYSQRYANFHRYLESTLTSTTYALHPLFIDQSVFDEHLYKHQGEHFFGRITVKVDAIIRILESRLAAAGPFIFSDCDLMIGSMVDDLGPIYRTTQDIDILFQQEIRDCPIVNPGFMMIWPNETTLAFWKTVRADIIDNHSMEMTSINKYLSLIRHKHFSFIHVCSSLTYSQLDYGVCHLISGTRGADEDMAEKLYQTQLLGQPIA